MSFFDDLKVDIENIKDKINEFSFSIKVDIVENKLRELAEKIDSEGCSFNEYFKIRDFLREKFPEVLENQDLMIQKLKENKWIYLDFIPNEKKRDIIISYLEDTKKQFEDSKLGLCEKPEIYIENIPYYFSNEDSHVWNNDKEFKDIVLKYVCILPNLVNNSGRGLQSNREFMIELIERNPEVFKYTKSYFKQDEDFCLELINSGHLEICKYFDDCLIDNSSFVEAIFKRFETFDISRDYDINSFLQNPKEAMRIIGSLDFTQEREKFRVDEENYDLNKNDSVDEIKDYNDIFL